MQDTSWRIWVCSTLTSIQSSPSYCLACRPRTRQPSQDPLVATPPPTAQTRQAGKITSVHTARDRDQHGQRMIHQRHAKTGYE
ncbi:hypothetical protein LX36DRAFT_476301 [Colletotrichum falcatum]|nr:hypothetical protein LX36DRAFT_476301 [Colletotrichum falcatum]